MKSLRHCAMLLLLATAFALPLAAQPQLDIQEVKADNFPTMQLHVAVRQNQVLRRESKRASRSLNSHPWVPMGCQDSASSPRREPSCA